MEDMTKYILVCFFGSQCTYRRTSAI